MLILEPETGPVMVEILHTAYDAEGFLGMALAAILPELVLMHVRMATGTGGISDAGKFLERIPFNRLNFMAFYTFHRLVFAFQLKFCRIVVKTGRRLEGIESMTIRTGRR